MRQRRFPALDALVDHAFGEFQRVLPDLDVLDAGEIGFGVAHLVGEAQPPQHDAAVLRLQHHAALAPVEHQARKPGGAGRLHRLPDHGEGFLADFV